MVWDNTSMLLYIIKCLLELLASSLYLQYYYTSYIVRSYIHVLSHFLKSIRREKKTKEVSCHNTSTYC